MRSSPRILTKRRLRHSRVRVRNAVATARAKKVVGTRVGRLAAEQAHNHRPGGFQLRMTLIGLGHHLRSAACQFVATVIDPRMSSVRAGT